MAEQSEGIGWRFSWGRDSAADWKLTENGDNGARVARFGETVGSVVEDDSGWEKGEMQLIALSTLGVLPWRRNGCPEMVLAGPRG